MLVNVMALERGHLLALGTQRAAAADQPSLVCLGSAGAWGVKGRGLLSCSNGEGYTRTAELLHKKGLFSLFPGSRAVTHFRDGVNAPWPHRSAFPHKGEELDHGGTQ